MIYAVTFQISGVKKNTWADWRLVPDTPPMIPPPEMNTNYVDIPGRGPVDLSLVPLNRRTYKRMSGSWNFYREPDNSRTRVELYEEMMKYFVGKEGYCELDEDKGYYYKGRFGVALPKTGTGPIQFAISFDLAPIRYTDISGGILYVDTNYAPY